MPILFSDCFKLDKSIIKKTGVFDAVLDVDTRFFVDPALIDICNEKEFINAHKQIENYFKNIIILLSHSNCESDMFWKKAEKMLTFKELTGTCCGYSKTGTNGNAIGVLLRKNILSTIKSLLDAGIKDPEIFELLGVFHEKIGCDRISDLITFILYKNILEYTQRVVLECGLESVNVQYDNCDYQLCVNPYNNKLLLLLPKVVMSPLPIMNTFDDIDRICLANDKVREDMNLYLKLNDRKKVSKKEIIKYLNHNSELLYTLLSSYKSIDKKEYDFENDPFGEYIWCAKSKEYTVNYPLDLSEISLSSINGVYDIAEKICFKFKSLIENNNLSRLLFNEDGSPKRETAAQLLFFGISFGYCEQNNIDLTREGNNGHGPFDFKLSKGFKEKIIVEVKLTSNSQLIHGVEKQLPTYMKQEYTNKGIYLIIDTGYEKNLNKFIEFYNKQDTEIKEKIKYIIIDATTKKSASKA